MCFSLSLIKKARPLHPCHTRSQEGTLRSLWLAFLPAGSPSRFACCLSPLSGCARSPPRRSRSLQLRQAAASGLAALAPPGAESRLQGLWALQPWRTGWAAPWHVGSPCPVTEPKAPALAGGFVHTSPPGESGVLSAALGAALRACQPVLCNLPWASWRVCSVRRHTTWAAWNNWETSREASWLSSSALIFQGHNPACIKLIPLTQYVLQWDCTAEGSLILLFSHQIRLQSLNMYKFPSVFYVSAAKALYPRDFILLKLKAIRNSVPELHELHFKWPTCRRWLVVTVFNSADNAFIRAETSISAVALISVFKIFNVLKVFSRKWQC